MIHPRKIIREAIIGALEGKETSIWCKYFNTQAMLINDGEDRIMCDSCLMQAHNGYEDDVTNEQLRKDFEELHTIHSKVSLNETVEWILSDTYYRAIYHRGYFVGESDLRFGLNRKNEYEAGTKEAKAWQEGYDAGHESILWRSPLKNESKVGFVVLVTFDDGKQISTKVPEYVVKKYYEIGDKAILKYLYQNVGKFKSFKVLNEKKGGEKEDKYEVLKHIRMPSPSQKGHVHKDETKYDRKRDKKKISLDETINDMLSGRDEEQVEVFCKVKNEQALLEKDGERLYCSACGMKAADSKIPSGVSLKTRFSRYHDMPKGKTLREAREWAKGGFDCPLDCWNASNDVRDKNYGTRDENADGPNFGYLIEDEDYESYYDKFVCSYCGLDSDDSRFESTHQFGGLVKSLNEQRSSYPWQKESCENEKIICYNDGASLVAERGEGIESRLVLGAGGQCRCARCDLRKDTPRFNMLHEIIASVVNESRIILNELTLGIHITNLTRALKEDDCVKAKEAFQSLLRDTPPGFKLENELRLTKVDMRLLVTNLKQCSLDVPRKILGITKVEKEVENVPDDKKEREKPAFNSSKVGAELGDASNNKDFVSFIRAQSLWNRIVDLYLNLINNDSTDIERYWSKRIPLYEFAKWMMQNSPDKMKRDYYKEIVDYYTTVKESYSLRDIIREIVRKVGDEYVLYSKKKNPKTGKRRRLGTSKTKTGIAKREKQVQFFKHQGGK